MKFNYSRVFLILPYTGLLIALLFGIYTFLKTEEYRYNTAKVLTQAFEIQWQVSQITRRLIQLNSYLMIANETGRISPDITRQIILIKVSIEQLLSLSYVEHFLFQREIKQLKQIQTIIEQRIKPIVIARSNYQFAIDNMRQPIQSMFEVSSSTVDHSAMMQKTVQLKIAAYRNILAFAILIFLTISYLFIYQRYIFIKRREQYFQSFSSLFVHTTQSRIIALRLFLENINSRRLPGEMILESARCTAKELETINNALLNITHSKRDLETELLVKILDNITRNIKDIVSLKISPEVTDLVVPTTQFHLLIDELFQNAMAAVKNKSEPRIIIHTHLKQRRFFAHTSLIIEIMDNGIGMPPDIIKKSVMPFFSTRAGKHTGLGLPSCLQMVSTLKGKLVINSTPNIGTIIKIHIPIK